MPSWYGTWYPFATQALRNLRGEGRAGADGVTMPLLHASDGISVLGQLSPGIVNAVSRFSTQMRTPIVRSDAVDSDGTLVIDQTNIGSLQSISAKEYVAGIGYPGQPYMRAPTAGADLYEPAILHNAITGDENQLLSFVRQLMGDWQRAVDAAAVMLSLAATSDDIADSGAVSVFLSSVRALCSDLDVLNENPPLTTADKIKGATLDALHTTEKFAGEAAANIAQEAGTLAGNVAEGFFAKAGVTSLVVAGLAVYLFIR